MHEVNGEAEFFVTPGYGRTLFDLLNYHQAVRIGDRVDISGQGGWYDGPEFPRFPESLEEEIGLAFDNVGRTLAAAGAGWADVVALDSFHVPTAPDSIGDEHNRAMTERLRHFFGDRPPIWTQVGVAALGAPGMRVEIRATAVGVRSRPLDRT